AGGGTMPYTYNWSNGGTTATMFGLGAGTYTVSITDANGCGPATATATITEPTAVTGSITGQTDVLCNGDNTGDATAIASGGTAPYSFTWSNGDNGTTADSLAAGTYTVTITDANGCGPVITTVTITEPSALTVDVISQVDVLCNGDSTGSATALATGGTPTYAYAWSNGDVGTVASGLAAGTYFVTATDLNGCVDVDSVTITEPPALMLSDSVTNVTCNGLSDGAIDLTVAGGVMPYSYLWSTGDNTEDVTNLAAGTYTVVVTDANGCVDSLSATVTEPVLLTVTTTGLDVLCEGDQNGEATATPAGGTAPYGYQWNDPLAQTTDLATNLAEGTYTVVVTDANGCTASDSVTIGFINTNPVVDLGFDTLVGCRDTMVTLTADPGLTYNWSTGATTQSITVDTSGTISLEVTDGNGCVGSDTVQVVFAGPCVGIDELFSSAQVRYYPNPTNGLINLEVNGLEGEDLTITVMDVQGRVILETQRLNLSTQFLDQLDLSEAAQGIYFVRLTTNGESRVDRISVK
ncbi:MAG: T9SS type A sorting domain-containing protein, partial [Bacteroidota bacterium]